MARKHKGYYTQANVKPVVYSSTYRANVNPTCDTDCNVKPPVASPVNMKQSVRCEVCHVNAVCDTQGNVK